MPKAAEFMHYRKLRDANSMPWNRLRDNAVVPRLPAKMLDVAVTPSTQRIAASCNSANAVFFDLDLSLLCCTAQAGKMC